MRARCRLRRCPLAPRAWSSASTPTFTPAGRVASEWGDFSPRWEPPRAESSVSVSWSHTFHCSSPPARRCFPSRGAHSLHTSSPGRIEEYSAAFNLRWNRSSTGWSTENSTDPADCSERYLRERACRVDRLLRNRSRGSAADGKDQKSRRHWRWLDGKRNRPGLCRGRIPHYRARNFGTALCEIQTVDREDSCKGNGARQGKGSRARHDFT